MTIYVITQINSFLTNDNNNRLNNIIFAVRKSIIVNFLIFDKDI